MLRNSKGKVLFVFSRHVGVKGSHEVEVLAILEARPIYPYSFRDKFIVEVILQMQFLGSPLQVQALKNFTSTSLK